MPRDQQTLVYVGIKNVVVALDEATGEEVWRTKLRGSDYVNVLWDGEALFATNSGEVWRLDPRSGVGLWHNQLKGLGLGIVSLASTRRPASDTGSVAAAKRHHDAQMAAATTAATI